MEPNGAFIGEEVRRAPLVEEDGSGGLPMGGGGLSEPHEDEQQVQRGMEGGRHEADEFIRQAIGAGGLVIGKTGEEGEEMGGVSYKGEKGRGRGRSRGEAEGVGGINAVPGVDTGGGLRGGSGPSSMKILMRVAGKSMGVSVDSVSQGVAEADKVRRVSVGIGVSIEVAMGTAGGGTKETGEATTVRGPIRGGAPKASNLGAGGPEQGVGEIEPGRPSGRGVGGGEGGEEGGRRGEGGTEREDGGKREGREISEQALGNEGGSREGGRAGRGKRGGQEGGNTRSGEGEKLAGVQKEVQLACGSTTEEKGGRSCGGRAEDTRRANSKHGLEALLKEVFMEVSKRLDSGTM